ncbi:hypothetical protein ASF87_02980 [Microbacterium sp. Leaf161]|uniref:hypothetical protein n=1 Tax=Microbacterium sp. Leaf161 TaxID=1736281 RepID=UPI0006F4A3B0|nr:hypothetical protein [Microbacterium sp. Leaf161]KQR47929.1 hypothetical protein ASF87_02980 [Microbacterium sp. Leaf161]
MNAATFFDGEEWRDGTIEMIDGRMLLRAGSPASDLRLSDLPRLDGVIVGGFTDHHVHLQLVDHALLHDSTLGRVIDLGGNPAAVAALTEGAARFVSVAFAGAFLTPVGGYPSDRDWAPAGSFREIADTAAATAAVAEMADAGASCIKVANNSTAGPVFSDFLFRAIVEAAASRGLPVVAHAEGEGGAQRAARLGAARLAHAPFTERLDDAEVTAQAASISWISTLAVHEGDTHATAVDNVRRFHAAGGIVLYGTDMGNGPMPVGLNPAELAALRDAGLDGIDLLRALAPQNPLDPAALLLRLPGTDADPTLARPLTSADLKA